MSKIKISNMSKGDIIKYLGNLYKALAAIDSSEEMKFFFGSLISSSEKVMLARRLQIAEKLLSGQTHLKIMTDLGVGNSTIMFVEKALTRMFYKKKNGLAKLKQGSKESYYNEPMTWDEIKNKYPAHFILFGQLWKSKDE
jgi:uncharacterized protein YerC